MEKIQNAIHKGQAIAVHVSPGDDVLYPVADGIDYNLATIYIKYSDRYAGLILTVIFRDANGHEKRYNKILDKGKGMSFMNDKPIDEPNFGFIGFACNTEIYFDFTFN